MENGAQALISRSRVARLDSTPAPHRCGDPHLKAGIDERGEEPNPVSLVRDCFQAARGRGADESASRVQRKIVRKNQAKSLRR